MKTLQVKKKDRTIFIVQVNFNSEKSITAAEKKVTELINAGYNLDTQHGGFSVVNFTYILNH